MRRICMSALLLSAFYGSGFDLPAFADPLQVTFSPYVMSQPVNVPPPQYVASQYAAAPQYAAPQYAAPQYVAPQYAAPQSVAPQYSNAPPQGYTGVVAPRYAAAAAPAPAGYAPPAPPAPASPGGGGFLEALFGGPTIPGHVYQYQPAAPDYQTSPAPGYAPSSQGDMSANQVDPKFDRQVVDYRGEEKPGTIVIDTPNKFLYLVEENGKALRYGIGVGRPGFTWAGEKTITAKREWPDWRPPADMLQRRPDLPRYMPGGIDNPLGARAMYLGSTLSRIHGSNEPWTIGTNVSSGCIRMRNEDVTDLYGRVKVGTKVVVI
jgi:lipoprotein-anchoring transpeptidase ErfK/SrfK